MSELTKKSFKTFIWLSEWKAQPPMTYEQYVIQDFH